jgi:hypothetical protein
MSATARCRGGFDGVVQGGCRECLALLPVVPAVECGDAGKNQNQHPQNGVAVTVPESFELIELFLFLKI